MIIYHTASEWTALNPVLGKYVVGVDSTNDEYRIGDGATHWNALFVGSMSFPPAHVLIECFAFWLGSIMSTKGEMSHVGCKNGFAGLVMTGMVLCYADNLPGVLECNGALYDQTDYPALFALIGRTFSKANDPAGQFRVPDIDPLQTKGGGTIAWFIKT